MVGGDDKYTPRWIVVHTRPRCEKKFARLMEATEFPHYLPLIARVRRYANGEKKKSMVPLFPGYVFAQVPPIERRRIYEQELVARAIEVDNEALFLRQMDAVRQIIHSGVEVLLRPLLVRGRAVRIVSGPLRGLEGVVDDPLNPRGVIIAVDVLQQGLLIPMEPEMLKALD